MTTFKNEWVSVSRLNLFAECPRAFFFRYVEKDSQPIPEDTSAPDLGKIVHAALEGYYALDVVGEEYAGPIDAEKLLGRFRAEASAFVPPIDVEAYRDGLAMLRAYARSHPHVDHMAVLDVEREFRLPVGHTRILGYIDRVDKVDDETVRIVDYKSSRRLYRREELEDDLQMSVYGWAARTLYPWARRFEFEFEMLRFDARQKVHRTAAEIDDVASYVAGVALATETTTEWPARLNPNCGYCASRRRCDAYGNALKKGHEATRSSKDDLPGLVAERATVARVAKVAYARQKEIDDVLRAAYDREGKEALIVGDTKIAFQAQFETTYPWSVIDAFSHYGKMAREEVERRLTWIDPRAVEALRDEVVAKVGEGEGKILSVTIDGLANKEPKTPKIDVRPVKKR